MDDLYLFYINFFGLKFNVNELKKEYNGEYIYLI